jgi:hypothetical protein
MTSTNNVESKIKRYLVIFMRLAISTFTFAQPNYQNIETLKNGSINQGMIHEQVPNKTTKTDTGDKNAFVYQVEMGYSFGNEYNYSTDFLKLNVINGYKFNPYFSLGLGAGIRYYYDEKDAVIPVFVNFMANFSDKKVSPYLALSTGYSLDIKKNYTIDHVGFLLNLTAGVSIKMSNITLMHVGIGYDMQKAEIFYDWLGTSYPKYLSSISINAAISFRHLGLIF